MDYHMLELLSPMFKQVFDKGKYQQANLSPDSGVYKCFQTSGGEGVAWIINFCSIINKLKKSTEPGFNHLPKNWPKLLLEMV